MQQEQRLTIITSSTAAVLSLLVFIPAKLKAPFTIILADRFVPGLGWLQIALLSAYGVFIAWKLTTASDTRRIRLAIWLTFSVVFFLQFILGVAGLENLLMTGRLHVPVPAVVIAGPIFRGERFFMPILFLSTLILAGPAWCSFLCYFGAWDGLAASRQKKATTRQPWWSAVRVTIFVMVPSAAILLRATGVSGATAAWMAVGFGVLGLAVTVAFSGKRGSMIHCTGYCPLGLAANLIGKISPFRIRLAQSCTECGHCTAACRYGALSRSRLQARRPGLTCTLCGDCLAACPHQSIVYRLGRLGPAESRAIFMGIVAGLHACFLGIARI